MKNSSSFLRSGRLYLITYVLCGMDSGKIFIALVVSIVSQYCRKVPHQPPRLFGEEAFS